TCFNGVDQLIDLFDRMETERLVVLFPIPWASFRRTQFGHYLQQFKYRWSEFSICLLAFSSRLSVRPRPPPRRRVRHILQNNQIVTMHDFGAGILAGCNLFGTGSSDSAGEFSAVHVANSDDITSCKLAFTSHNPGM